MPGPPDALRIELLGGFRVAIGARIIDAAEWRLRRAASLVKLLALARDHRLHREHLMEVLWPDQEPSAAANNLHKTVYTARRALEPGLGAGVASGYLHAEGDALVLRPPEALWVDVEAFREAAARARGTQRPDMYEAALALYTGSLLPEDRYEDWAAGHREELRTLYLALLLETASLQETTGDSTAAANTLRRVIEEDPAHEEAHAALMRIHARAGRRHQALRQYKQLRDALRRELDVDPTAATQQLHADIVTGRVGPALPGGTRTSGTPAMGGSGELADARMLAVGLGTLIGRDAEIEVLEDTLDALFDGRGGLVLLAGEAGIGKSRLAAEMVERVRRRGGTALRGAAYEAEGQLPYGPFAEALDQLGDPIEPGGLRALFSGMAGDMARLPPPAVSAMRADRQRLFSSIADALRRKATESPVLVVLDDLHDADEASLQLLHYLARTTRETRVLLLGTFRPEDAPAASALGRLIGVLRREQLLVRLDLKRLSPRDSDLLVESLLGGTRVDRAVLETTQRLAAGNPFFTEEVVRSLRERGQLRQVDGSWRLVSEDMPLPTPVLDLLAGRLERLGPAGMQMLGVAAVVGREAAYPLLRAVSELTDDEALNALDACLASGVLQETPTGYSFGHPLLRAATYEHLSRARRAVLHGRVAAALEVAYAGRLDGAAEVLAHHWALSERPERAVPYLVQAGDRAASVHAREAAISAYRQALELLRETGTASDIATAAAQLWEKLGDLWALAGDAPRDADAYAAALEVVSRGATTPPELAARLHRKAAYAALARHDVGAATSLLVAAEALVSGDSEEWGRVRLVRALWHWERGQHTEGRRAAEESVTFARQRGEGMDLINAYMTLALVFHSSGEWKEGLEIEIQHLGGAADSDARLGLLFDAHACLGEYHLYGDTSFDVIEDYARRMLELAVRTGARRAQGLALLLLGGAHAVRGRWDEAQECLERGLQLQAAVGSAAGQALALQRLAELSVYRGDDRAAGDLLRRAWDLPVGAPMAPHVYGRLYATEALRALEGGDPEAARRMVEAAADSAASAGDCATCSAVLHPVATETYAALGDRVRAEQHSADAARAAAHWESGAWRAMAERCDAVVRLASGDAAQAADRFLAAAESFERIGQPYDVARCLLGASRAQAKRGAAEEARSLAERARDIFVTLGAASARTREQLTSRGALPGESAATRMKAD